MSTKTTNINQAGIDLITSFEGLELKPYLCSSLVPTIGYGTTRYPNGVKVTLKDASITKDKAIEYFKYDIKQFELAVDTYTTDSVSANQFSALVSFAYNCGAKALKDSTLLKKVNINPNDPTIEQEFLKWNKSGGKVSKGLIRRREAEWQLYNTK